MIIAEIGLVFGSFFVFGVGYCVISKLGELDLTE